MNQKRSTIFKALESFPRVELEDIRQYFGADVPTKVRKSEFVDRLGAYIIEKPAEWLGRMLERDLRLLKRLVDAGPGVPLYLDYPDFPSVLETIRLLGSDTSDENFREVWIPKDFYDVVAPHIDNVLMEGQESGLFETEQAALGYLSLYGIMTTDEFFDCMLDYWEYSGRHSIEYFTNMVYDSPVMKLCRVDHDGGRYLSAPNIFDPDEILTGRKEYSGIESLRPFTPQDALKAGAGSPYFVYGLDSEEGRRLVEMLGNLGYKGEDLAREEHDIWMNAQMIGKTDTTEAIFASVTRKQDGIESFEDYDECMEIVAAYANTLPKWLLKGYSSNEVNSLKVVLQTEDDPLQSMIRKNPLLGLFVPPTPPDAHAPAAATSPTATATARTRIDSPPRSSPPFSLRGLLTL